MAQYKYIPETTGPRAKSLYTRSRRAGRTARCEHASFRADRVVGADIVARIRSSEGNGAREERPTTRYRRGTKRARIERFGPLGET